MRRTSSRSCGFPNVLPSSTNPTRPFTEHHRRTPRHADGLPPPRPEHRRGRRLCRKPHPPRNHRRRRHPARPRRVLDDQLRQPGHGPRRRGDHAHLADRRQDEKQRGRPEDGPGNTTSGSKRYIAKYTINPAITHGISHEVGFGRGRQMGDLVLWRPAFFRRQPTLIFKGGAIAASLMGDANASIPRRSRCTYRPMFASYGGSRHATSFTFISQAAFDAGVPEQLGLKKKIGVKQRLSRAQKTDLIHNDYLPNIEVDAQNYQVKADGQLLWSANRRMCADGAALFSSSGQQTQVRGTSVGRDARSCHHASSHPAPLANG